MVVSRMTGGGIAATGGNLCVNGKGKRSNKGMGEGVEEE